jgi:hypothetical protein
MNRWYVSLCDYNISIDYVKTIKGNGCQIWIFYKIVFFPRIHSIFTKLILLADENEFSLPVFKILASSCVAFTSSQRKCKYPDIIEPVIS